MISRLAKIKLFFKKYEKSLMPVFLLGGFIVDTITLNRVDQWFDNMVLLFYIVLAGVTILLIHANPKVSLFTKYQTFLPFVLQYAFGGLFSGLLIFYFRSGSILTSFPFILILIGLFIGNEFFKEKYERMIFRVSVFFIAILSYSILIVPVIFGRINVFMFLIGVAIGAIVIQIFILLLKRTSLEEVKPIYISIIGTLIIFNLLYFTNIIPPIPLSLKDGGAFYSLERVGQDKYVVQTEKIPWYRFLFFESYSKDLNLSLNQPVYAFSAVFAPTKLTGTIYHEWLFFDETKKRWVPTDRIPISITGGRDDGFRGYSTKSSLSPGLWRVDIETKSKQVIGRLQFNIDYNVSNRDELITKTY